MNIIIVGGGQVGSSVARKLKEEGHTIKILETNKKIYEKLVKEFTKEEVYNKSGSDPDVLEEVGIFKADVLAAITGFDEVNLVVSTLGKMEFGVPKVVARVNHPKNEWLFTASMGVDESINQASLMADIIIKEDILDK